MPAAKSKGTALPFDASRALLEAFAINDRINQFLLENLPEEAWRADPPTGKGRTVAAIVSHMGSPKNAASTAAITNTPHGPSGARSAHSHFV